MDEAHMANLLKIVLIVYMRGKIGGEGGLKTQLT
jgi:hypothetical protein